LGGQPAHLARDHDPEGAAAAAESLQGQARGLLESMSRFKISGGKPADHGLADAILTQRRAGTPRAVARKVPREAQPKPAAPLRKAAGADGEWSEF